MNSKKLIQTARKTRDGTIVREFFPNVSKEERKKRFPERIDNPDKNWK